MMAQIRTPEQVARDLYQGRGRPYLVLQSDDAARYHEPLLTACLYNPVYDRQFTGCRADDRYGLLALTGNTAHYRRSLLAALDDPDDELDQKQLLDFALIWA